ncbi:Polyisoprenyl-teichoic acid--peptidoglycan teichoic acid transferase TagU [Neobacillus rhizosphaerae]|uniref:Polyisoprenyl-teichoic acid--peptidoglycan teichoic acid transferase TagU n=1 Tax=Neobacillus rhizosphaerae TaxID=2880965 RepID=A0ABN8KKE3_9BACI|nr:LytR family transcriptional regulator [Neobacillus rhizosphaerae]CAH2713889.1 Polyisoprenyl-teichoic acid--peptidoglycan teichoic acid transferase TagU [Neobacillus rhizosphaerae]
MSSRAKRKKKKPTWLKVLLSIIVLLIVATGAYAYTVYHSLTSAVETMHSPLDREKSDKRTDQVSLKQAQPFSVALLGVDQRPGDRGRADSIIVMAVNPDTSSVKMLSIPRDTRTEIVGKGTVDKINHSYAFGGVKMSLDTIEKFLDIPIDYYVQVNMEGFKDIVNSVGGVTVNNDLDFTSDGTHFPKGQLTLNGEKALKFSRMRHEDPRGDFGRQQRQRQIIQGVINEGASLSSLTNFSDIFSALGNNVKTNLTFNEMVTIQSKYKKASKSIDQISVKAQGTKIDGISYQLISDEEKARIHQILVDQLELKK